MNKLAFLTWLRGLSTSLFPHAKAVRYVLTGFVILLIIAMGTHCRKAEADSSIAFEAGVQYLRGPAAAVIVNTEYEGPGDASIEPGLFLVGRTDEGRGVMGGQVLLVDGFSALDVGIGLAVMNTDHENLGSRLNFALMVRYNFGSHAYVAVRHFSNSGTTENNTGLDLLMFGWRF